MRKKKTFGQKPERKSHKGLTFSFKFNQPLGKEDNQALWWRIFDVFDLFEGGSSETDCVDKAGP